MPRLAAVAALLVLASCSTLKVSHDYDTRFDFSSFETYAWLPATANVDISGLTIRRIHEAVDRVLAAKGYRPTDDAPDFRVAIHASVEKKFTVTDTGYSMAHSRYWGYPYSTVHVDSYDQGTLVIDIIDAASNAAVWRGVATRAVSRQSSPEYREARINEAVTAVLEPFPPPPKS
jgi:hypothetical protein